MEPTKPWYDGIVSPKEYAKFLKLVTKYFKRKKINITIEGRWVHPKSDEPNFKPGKISLFKILRTCSQHPPAKWQEYITQFFDTRMDVFKSSQEDPFEEVKHSLKARIWPLDLWKKDISDVRLDEFPQDLPGTITALTIDYPDKLVHLRNTSDIAKQWDQTKQDLYQLALSNVYTQNPIKFKEFPVQSGDYGELIIWVASDQDNPFVATHALLLDKYPKMIGTFGTLVSLPLNHLLMLFPVENTAIERVIALLVSAALRLEGCRIPTVYWYHKGEYHPFFLTQEKNQPVEIKLFPGYERLLKTLPDGKQK